MVNIYCLKDPDSGLVFYVGQTGESLKTRLYQHMLESKRNNNRKCQQVREIAARGKRPIVEMIEQCSEQEGHQREHHWIRHYLEGGTILANGSARDKPVATRKQRKRQQVEGASDPLRKTTVLSKRLVRVKCALNDMTVRQLGHSIGMMSDADYIYRILDKDTVQLRTLAKVAEVLGCSICDILEEVEDGSI